MPPIRLRRLFAGALLATVLFPRAARCQDPAFYDETYLPTIQLLFPMDDWLDRLVQNFGRRAYVEADLYVDGVLVAPMVGVQHKGDASYNGDARENMKITLDAFVEGQEYRGYDKITVDSGEQTSVFTEVAALWVLGEFQDAPLANLAHVYAGTSNLMLDLGVFTNTERVDKRFLDDHFTGDGHRYWQNFQSLPFEYKGENVDDYVGVFESQGGDRKTRWQDVAAAAIALEHAEKKHYRDDLDPLLSMDLVERNIIGNRMVGNFDGLEVGNNFYLCESVRHGSRLMPVLWDMDFSFTSSKSNPVPAFGDNTNFPFKKVFLYKHEEERSHAFVRYFLAAGFAPGVVENRLNALEELALPFMLGSSYDPIHSRQDADRAVARCVDWIDNKRTALEADPLYQRSLPRFAEVGHGPQEPREGEDVWVRAELDLSTVDPDEVLVWSRVRGAFTAVPLYDDGLHQDDAAGDGVFGGTLPAYRAGDLVQYYVEVRPVDRSLQHYGFFPEKTELDPLQYRVRLATPGEVLIDEFLADNGSTDYDEYLEAEDWIELVNTGSVGLDLEGWALSDDLLREHLFEFPAGTYLPAAGRLRVWADGQPEQGPLHADFRLAKAGGSIFLRRSEALGGGLSDEVDYGPQVEDRSFARVPSGGEHWFHLWRPTALLPVARPGENNRYDTRPDGAPSGARLKADGTAEVGQTLRLEYRDGTADGIVFWMFSAAPASLPFGSFGPLLVDPRGWWLVRDRLDGGGDATLSFVVPPEAADLVVYLQVLDTATSNGLTVHIR